LGVYPVSLSYYHRRSLSPSGSSLGILAICFERADSQDPGRSGIAQWGAGPLKDNYRSGICGNPSLHHKREFLFLFLFLLYVWRMKLNQICHCRESFVNRCVSMFLPPGAPFLYLFCADIFGGYWWSVSSVNVGDCDHCFCACRYIFVSIVAAARPDRAFDEVIKK
jgi:hypothetical protein